MDYVIRYGVDNMTKKKVWMSFCIVMIFLLTCTVLSIRIEKMMRIDVETCTAEVDEETNTAKLPKSCYQFDEFESAVFCVEEKEGLFGKELVATKEEMAPMYEEDGYAVIPSSFATEESGRLIIIQDATWSVEEGDVVVRRKETEVDVNRQIWVLSCLAAMLLPGFLLLRRSVRKLGDLQEGNRKAGLEGIVLIAIWLCVVYLCMGQLEIPRQYLPQESILDIKFYIEELRSLNFFHDYKKELCTSGICILGLWSVTLFFKRYFVKLHLKKQKIQDTESR